MAARTENIRIGYGVRLAPRPYNHPVRSAESAAVLDLLSDGRVDFGTGRSSTRIELEGFGVHPDDLGGRRANVNPQRLYLGHFWSRLCRQTGMSALQHFYERGQAVGDLFF